MLFVDLGVVKGQPAGFGRNRHLTRTTNELEAILEQVLQHSFDDLPITIVQVMPTGRAWCF